MVADGDYVGDSRRDGVSDILEPADLAPARTREGTAPRSVGRGSPVADAAAGGAAPLAFWKPLADLPRMLEEITAT